MCFKLMKLRQGTYYVFELLSEFHTSVPITSNVHDIMFSRYVVRLLLLRRYLVCAYDCMNYAFMKIMKIIDLSHGLNCIE